MLQKSAKAYGISISTHAPAGGATRQMAPKRSAKHLFLLTPLREGRLAPVPDAILAAVDDFYSRPCGRGRLLGNSTKPAVRPARTQISTHAPAGGATRTLRSWRGRERILFLLTPLREWRPLPHTASRQPTEQEFLLTPLREGRRSAREKEVWMMRKEFLLTPLREGRLGGR